MSKTIQRNTGRLEFASVTEMRAFTGGSGLKNGETVYLYDSTNPGNWEWDTSSSAADDGVDVVKITSWVGNGRFLRLQPNAANSQYNQGGTGAADATQKEYNQRIVSSKDYGGLSDGSTDDTQAILDAANNSGSKVIFLPYNTKYDQATLLASLPTDVVCLDFSAINSFDSAGETTKRVGIISSDESVNDTHWEVSSNHHPIMALNNYGGAGSSSASARRASLVWFAGKLNGTGSAKDGFRDAAIMQFSQEAGEDFWIWQIRSRAPWLAIDGEYERWEQGLSVTTGDYYAYNDMYVAASTGTTGATPPTHTSGTVSDGGVDWTFVDFVDRTTFTTDQYGRVKINGGVSESDIISARPASVGSSGTANYQFGARNNSQNAALKLVPKDSGGSDSTQPFLLAQDGVGLRVMKSDGASDVARFDDTGLLVGELRLESVDAADGDTTPSVAGAGTLYLSNTGATDVTFFDDGKDDQTLDVVATNGNTTLKHSSTLNLPGAVDLTMSAYQVVSFHKIKSSISNRWVMKS